MREIKFRAWDKENNEMIEDYCALSMFEVYGFWSSEKFEYMQYTGLKDRNGKEIYEGDIVEFPETEYNQKFTSEIIFKDGKFKAESFIAGEDLTDYRKIEVIGNIYENPELIK